MISLFSTRSGAGATGIRAQQGGSASHCALVLPAGTVLRYADGSPRVLQTPRILDAQPWRGVQDYGVRQWLDTHHLLGAYDVPLPDERAGLEKACSMHGWGYDWWRNVGYLLWREINTPRHANCESVMVLSWLAGRRTLATRPARIGVRTLHEIAHACGVQVNKDDLLRA